MVPSQTPFCCTTTETPVTEILITTNFYRAALILYSNSLERDIKETFWFLPSRRPWLQLRALCWPKYYRYNQACMRINVSFWLVECSSFQKGSAPVSYKTHLRNVLPLSAPAPLHFSGLPLAINFIFLGQLFLTVRMWRVKIQNEPKRDTKSIWGSWVKVIYIKAKRSFHIVQPSSLGN